MTLNQNEAYRTKSMEERISIIEMIYNHNPRLISTRTYTNRYLVSSYLEYPILKLMGGDNIICGWSDLTRYSYEIPKEDFLNKLLGYHTIDNGIKYKKIKHKFA